MALYAVKEPAGTVQQSHVVDTDFEVKNLGEKDMEPGSAMHLLRYSAVGLIFGIVFVKGEVVSWFRIQEMFRFQSFHMYGVIGTAVVIGMISVQLIKRFKLRTINGDPITFQQKKFNKGQIIGGLLFGFGWAMTGACPGPLFAQIAMGFWVVMVVLVSAIAGTWTYGYFRDKLPH